MAQTWPPVPTDTGWIAATLLSGWSNLGSGYAPARYRRINGVVHVEGTIQGGTATNGAVMMTLPAGFRPSGHLLLAVALGASVGRVEVQSGGDIVVRTVVSPVTLHFSFPADQ